VGENQVRFKAGLDTRCPGGEFSGDIKIALLDDELNVIGKLKPLDSHGELLLDFADNTESISYSIYQKNTLYGIDSLSHITYLDMPLGHTYKAGMLKRNNPCECPSYTVQHKSVSPQDFSSFYGVIGTPMKERVALAPGQSRYQLQICNSHALMMTHYMNAGSATVVNAGIAHINTANFSRTKVNTLELEKLKPQGAVRIRSNKIIHSVSASSMNTYHALDAAIFSHQQQRGQSTHESDVTLDQASNNSYIWQLSATGREACFHTNGCQWSVRNWYNPKEIPRALSPLNFPASFKLINAQYSEKSQRIDWQLKDQSLNAYSKQTFTILQGPDRVAGEIYAPLSRSGYPIPEILGHTDSSAMTWHQFDVVGYDTLNNYQALVLDATYSINDNSLFNPVKFEYRYITSLNLSNP
jgi:hypothetical protein